MIPPQWSPTKEYRSGESSLMITVVGGNRGNRRRETYTNCLCLAPDQNQHLLKTGEPIRINLWKSISQVSLDSVSVEAAKQIVRDRTLVSAILVDELEVGVE